MGEAKKILVKPIHARDAKRGCKLWHYSGKVVNNSNLHLGVFYRGRMAGVMSFGSPMDKRRTITMVRDTRWDGMMELNRMAFSDVLPRNSESRALSIAFKLIRRHYPQIEWILSFSDATQCGDGTIYRAAGFVLTQIKKNSTLLRMPDGSVVASKTLGNPNHTTTGRDAGWWRKNGAVPLEGYQLRYVYFLKPGVRERLVGEEIPFSKIDEMGIGMYKGEKRAPASGLAEGVQPSSGGSTPTRALHSDEDPRPPAAAPVAAGEG